MKKILLFTLTLCFLCFFIVAPACSGTPSVSGKSYCLSEFTVTPEGKEQQKYEIGDTYPTIGELTTNTFFVVFNTDNTAIFTFNGIKFDNCTWTQNNRNVNLVATNKLTSKDLFSLDFFVFDTSIAILSSTDSEIFGKMDFNIIFVES